MQHYTRKFVKYIGLGIGTSTLIIAPIAYHKINLPPEQKINVVFDLDQTLIYSKKSRYYNRHNMTNYKNYNWIFKYIDDDNKTKGYHVWARPYVYMVLPILSALTNVHLYTRASEDYTEDILDGLNIRKYFLTLNYCLYNQKHKDVNKVIDVNINKNLSILVDDDMKNRHSNQEFIHIPQYYPHNLYDYELLKVLVKILWRI